jgi:spore germination protein GerM
MLNKDCKIKDNKNGINNKIKPSPKKGRSPSRSASSSKKNRFFYLMLVLWLIPVGVSGYLLYVQYNHFAKASKAKRHQASALNKPVISRDQMRELTRSLPSNAEEETTPVEIKTAKFYLVKVNKILGRIYLKSVNTNVALDKDKIYDAMRKLVMYKLTRSLKKKHYYSCIPSDARLLRAKVSGQTLVLDFSRHFIINSGGTQQIRLKAAQIVYTATQFPGINKVMFKINGKKLKDWGGEGVFPSSVLSRSDVPRIMSLN